MPQECPICELASADRKRLWSLRRPEVFATAFWRAVLHGQDQRYPGRCILAARRCVRSLADLSDDEWADLRRAIGRLEAAAAAAFGSVVHNWGCLMNHAFRADPPRPHVHLHFRPRYAEPVEILGQRFEDQAFASHYEREYRLVDDATLHGILENLRAAAAQG